MTRIYVIRHGQSEGNLLGEFHGQCFSDLTEFGHKQAEATAVYLDAFPIDAIYSSDIPRAYHTACHTAERRGLPITKDSGLREIACGEWERMKFEEIPVKYPKEYDVWFHNMSASRCPGGESVREVCDRVSATLDRIAAANDGKCIAVFSHATPLRIMETVWKHEPLEAMDTRGYVPNASVSIIDYDNNGGHTIVQLGYAEHLKELGMLTGLPKNI